MDKVRDIRNRRFYWIDNDFLDEYGADLGATGIAVYNALARRANEQGKAWPGKADIQRLTGLSRYGVNAGIKKLVERGIIAVSHRYDPVSRCWRSNIYTLLPIVGSSDTQGRNLESPGVGISDTQGRNLESPGVGISDTQVGISADDLGCPAATEQHPRTTPKNKTNITRPKNKTGQQQQATKQLPAAAASLLSHENLNPDDLNGTALNVASWILYAYTQSGIKNPAGYAIAQARKGEVPEQDFRDIVNVDLDLADLVTEARYERNARNHIQGTPDPCYQTEPLSDQALSIILTFLEGRSL